MRRLAAAASHVDRAAGATNAIKRGILSLILFGIAFGYVEASIVVYLRALAGPWRASAGLAPDDIFPLLNVRDVAPHLLLVKIEMVREAATIVMLAAAALAVGKNPRAWLAAFAVAFGVWDLSFYAWLKALAGWPESLFTWDLLFLLPVPWIGPVLAPVIVSISLVAGGIIGLMREPARVSRTSLALLLAGAAIILIAFTWDWRHIVYGGTPRSFPWAMFASGEMLGIVTTGLALSGSNRKL